MSDATLNLQACLLIYDIPENSAVANPSPRLRRMAVRVNLSCWVIREGDIPYALLNTMAEGGATWHVVQFDATEAGKLIGMATEALKRDLREALRRAGRSAERASEHLDTLEGTARPQAARPLRGLARYDEQSKAIVRRVKNLLNDARLAATRFGITEDQLSLASARDAVMAIHVAMRERARLYAEAAAQVRQLGDAAMATVAEADQVPAEILADRVEDLDGDASALRAAFAPPDAA